MDFETKYVYFELRKVVYVCDDYLIETKNNI